MSQKFSLDTLVVLTICKDGDVFDKQVTRLFESKVKTLMRVSDKNRLVEYMKKKRPDLIMAEHTIIKYGHFELLRLLRRMDSRTPILISMTENEESDAQELMILGNCYQISNPIKVHEIKRTLEHALPPLMKTRREMKEKNALSTMFNNLPNLVVVTDGKTIKECNGEFLRFFDIPDLKQFNMTYPYLGKLFVPLQNYIKPSNHSEWLKAILDSPQGMRKVMMVNESGESRKFVVNVQTLEHSLVHIVTFTDITADEDIWQSKLNALEGENPLSLAPWQHVKESMDKEIHRAKRYKTKLCLAVMCLVDHNGKKDTLDRRNDKLFTIAEKVIDKVIRPTDYFGKWENNRYVILAVQTGLDGSKIMGERIILECHSNFLFKQSQYKVKIGVVEYEDGEQMHHLLKRGGAALSLALKEAGSYVHLDKGIQKEKL